MPLLPHPIEPLETRIAPATFTVITAADAGAGSFRQALLEANGAAGSDTIIFSLAGSGVQTINLATALPLITDPVIIDGTTQPGFVAGGAPRIELTGTALGVGANGLEVAAPGVKIGGLTINHFAGAGIVLGASGGTVTGSYIGTDATGTGTGTPANGVGIRITGRGHTVGGVTAALGNVISGNTGEGILLTGRNAVENSILGNNIGSLADVMGPLANGTGIRFSAGANGNLVGGLDPGALNIIAGNLGAGVATSADSLAAGNVISGNRIFKNGGLGIDIFDDGVTPNTAGHQAFPVITQALIGGGRTVLRGTLTSTPSSIVAVQFFIPDPADPTGYGEAENFFGATGVSTDAAGLGTFSASFDAQLNPGVAVSAIAIDAAGNTSEFSLSVVSISAAVAPVISTEGRTATFTDVDGDRVTVRTSKGQFAQSNFQINAGTSGGGQLQTLDLHNDAAEFNGANITISAQRTAAGGDGFVNVGYLNATDLDLGSVQITGDLGRIDAGDGTASTPALKSLKVHSLSRYFSATQALPAILDSVVVGTLGKATITTDLVGSSLTVTGNLDSLTIGGSVIGGANATLGAIFVSGSLGKVRIGGDIIGGSASGSGSLGSVSIKEISIGGSLIGGTAANSGILVAGTGGIGKVSIGDRIVGNPSATGIAVNGSIQSNGRIGSITLAHNLLGGASADSGSILGVGIGSVTIGGTLLGGAGDRSGTVQSNGTLGATKILGSLIGGSGATSGSVFGFAGITSISVAQSLEGGAGPNSGTIVSAASLGPVKVGGSLQRGSGELSGSISALTHITSVEIKGTLFADISTLSTIGKVKIGRDVSGLISARGHTGATTASAALAIASISIGGDFDGSIFAGFDHLTRTWTNPDVQIGAITIGHNATLARISAGVNPGPNFQFGDGDDFVIAGGNALVSQIASITVQGQVGGFTTGEHFGFAAQQISKLQIGSVKFPLTSGTDRFDLGTQGNFSLREA